MPSQNYMASFSKADQTKTELSLKVYLFHAEASHAVAARSGHKRFATGSPGPGRAAGTTAGTHSQQYAASYS